MSCCSTGRTHWSRRCSILHVYSITKDISLTHFRNNVFLQQWLTPITYYRFNTSGNAFLEEVRTSQPICLRVTALVLHHEVQQLYISFIMSDEEKFCEVHTQLLISRLQCVNVLKPIKEHSQNIEQNPENWLFLLIQSTRNISCCMQWTWNKHLISDAFLKQLQLEQMVAQIEVDRKCIQFFYFFFSTKSSFFLS